MSQRVFLAMACAVAFSSPSWAQDPQPVEDPGSDGMAQLIPMSNAARGGAVVGAAPGVDPITAPVQRAIEGMIQTVGQLEHIYVRGGQERFDSAIQSGLNAMLSNDTMHRFLGEGHGLSERQVSQMTDAMRAILERAGSAPDPQTVLRSSLGILSRDGFVDSVVSTWRDEEQTAGGAELSRTVDAARAMQDVSQQIRTRVTAPIQGVSDAPQLRTAITQRIDGTGGGEVDVEAYRHMAEAVGRMRQLGSMAPLPEHMTYGFSAAMNNVERVLLEEYHRLRAQSGAPNMEHQLLESYRALASGEGQPSPDLDATAAQALRGIAETIRTDVTARMR